MGEPVGEPRPPSNPAPRVKPAKRIGLRVAAICLLVVGLVAVGASLGWYAKTRIAAPPTPQVEARTVVVPELPSAVAVSRAAPQMPDVRGLTQADAEQAVADAGIDPGLVTVDKVPSVGDAGRVVAQQPLPGAVDVSAVVLSLPVPAKVPDLVGDSETEGRAALAALGSIVSIRREYDARATPGTVIAVEPAVGETLTAESVLVLAADPAVIALAQVDQVENACSTDEIGVNGTTYPQGLRCETGDTAREAVWLVNRRTAGLTATVGVLDTGKPTDTATVTVSGDGKVLATLKLRYGTTQKLDVPLTGVLRLTISVIAPTRTEGAYPQVGLGAAFLSGAQADLDTLTAS